MKTAPPATCLPRDLYARSYNTNEPAARSRAQYEHERRKNLLDSARVEVEVTELVALQALQDDGRMQKTGKGKEDVDSDQSPPSQTGGVS